MPSHIVIFAMVSPASNITCTIVSSMSREKGWTEFSNQLHKNFMSPYLNGFNWINWKSKILLTTDGNWHSTHWHATWHEMSVSLYSLAKVSHITCLCGLNDCTAIHLFPPNNLNFCFGLVNAVSKPTSIWALFRVWGFPSMNCTYCSQSDLHVRGSLKYPTSLIYLGLQWPYTHVNHHLIAGLLVYN